VINNNNDLCLIALAPPTLVGYFAFQFVQRCKIPVFQYFSCKNSEPYFNLIHPGAMFGSIYESNPVAGIRKKSFASFLIFQNTRFAFDSQIVFDAKFGCYQLHKFSRFMRVELVRNKNPAAFRSCAYRIFYYRHKIFFRSCWTYMVFYYFSSSLLEAWNEG